MSFDEGTVVMAETFAERLEPESDLDTTLAVWNDTEQTTVTMNDNVRTEDGWRVDSKVGFRAEPQHVYHVIADPHFIEHFRDPTPEVRYRLKLWEGDEAALESIEGR